MYVHTGYKGKEEQKKQGREKEKETDKLIRPECCPNALLTILSHPSPVQLARDRPFARRANIGTGSMYHPSSGLMLDAGDARRPSRGFHPKLDLGTDNGRSRTRRVAGAAGHWSISIVIQMIQLAALLSVCRASGAFGQQVTNAVRHNGGGSDYSPAEHSNRHQHEYNDQWSIPLDREVSLYILSGQMKRLSYFIDERSAPRPPLTWTVTPCSDPIEWSLYFKAHKYITHKGRRSRGPVHHSRHRRNRKRKRKRSFSPPVRLTNFDTVSTRRTYSDIPRHSGVYVLQLNSKGRDSMVRLFVSQYYPYPLLPNDPSLTAARLDGQGFRIDWQPSPSESIVNMEYTVIVNEDANMHSSCQVEEELGDVGHGKRRMEEDDDVEDDTRLNSAPTLGCSSSSSSSSPFNDWWLKTMRKLARESRRDTQRIRSAPIETRRMTTTTRRSHTESRRRGVRMGMDNKAPGAGDCVHCVLFDHLKPATTYFVDVMGRNLMNNYTSIYRGLNVTTGAPARPPIRIRDRRLINVKLSRSGDYEQAIGYTVFEGGGGGGDAARKSSRNQTIWLFLQTCDGGQGGPVQVGVKEGTQDGNIVHQEVIGMATILIPIMSHFGAGETGAITALDNNSKSRELAIRLSSEPMEDGGQRTVNMFISRKEGRYPFPRLPADTSLRVFDTLTTCKSVTLAWMASRDRKVRYCIYRHQLSAPGGMGSSVTELLRPMNTCPQMVHRLRKRGRSGGAMEEHGGTKVACRRYHKYSKRRFNDVIMQRIRGLKPSREYIFHLTVKKFRGQSLYYESVWTATKACRD